MRSSVACFAVIDNNISSTLKKQTENIYLQAKIVLEDNNTFIFSLLSLSSYGLKMNMAVQQICEM
jgi:hypothetical protein